MSDSHTTSNFTETASFKLKEDNLNINGFIEPLVSPRSNNSNNCNTYRPSRPSQLLPSSTSLYSFKQQSTNHKQSETTSKRLSNKPQSQLVSPIEHSSKISLNSEADYAGKLECCLSLNVVLCCMLKFFHFYPNVDFLSIFVY